MGQPIRIGLVGSGFMGRCHANAFRSVGGLFPLALQPVLELIADIDEAAATKAAGALGFRRSTGDWRRLVADPDVDLVAITTPNALHAPIALAAIAAGKKAVYCEKPLAADPAAAQRMAEAARSAGAVTMVGFNYLRNPMIRTAGDIIASGEIGSVIGFRGVYGEDYMANPATPHSFRTDPAGAGGALHDIGSHLVSLARYLLGPIEAVVGVTTTIHPARPAHAGESALRQVEVDDRAVFLARFASGLVGAMDVTWAATGRKMQLAFEIAGTRGSLAFTQERMNELRLYEAGQPAARAGFKLIESGPAHPPYGAICPAAGHQLGFNDLKIIEVAELLQALSGGAPAFPDFAEGWAVQRTLAAVLESSATGAWVTLPAG